MGFQRSLRLHTFALRRVAVIVFMCVADAAEWGVTATRRLSVADQFVRIIVLMLCDVFCVLLAVFLCGRCAVHL